MKNKKILIAPITILFCLALIAFKLNGSGTDHDKHEEHEEHDEGKEAHHEEEGLIELNEEQVKNAEIVLEKVTAGSLKTELSLPAEVKLNADQVAHIYPRFSGIVKQVQKSVGDYVKKGEVLAILESNENLNNFPMQSMIDGTIIEKHIALGEMIREDAECFTIADLSSVWIDINVYPKDLAKVKKGSSVRIVAANQKFEEVGTVHYLNPVVSEHTRTALARVKLSNQKNQWQPGTFVTAFVTSSSIEVPLIIKKEAIQNIEGKPSVFIQEKPGHFRVINIVTGRESNNEIEVISGISKDSLYVSQGSFILKAELGKSEAEHEH